MATVLNNSAVHRVAVRYIRAKVQVTEENGWLSVTGAYAEMVSIFPKLKTWGFRYNGSDRSWGINSTKLTGIKRKRFEELLGLAKPKSTPRAFDPDANRELFRILTSLRTFPSTPRLDGAMLFTGPHLDLVKTEALAAGGEFHTGGLVFPLLTTDPDKFQDLVKRMRVLDREVRDRQENQARERAKKVEDIDRLVGTSRTWTYANLTLYPLPQSAQYIISGNTYAYKDIIKGTFDKPLFTNLHWKVSVDEPLANFAKFLVIMDKAEIEAKAVTVKKVQQPPKEQPRKENRKSGPCHKCGGVVAPGEGWLIHTYDNEGGSGDFIWVVEHKNPGICKAIIAEAKERARLRANKALAVRELRAYAEKHGQYTAGDHRLQGERIYITGRDQVLHGGGEWVQIEPGGRYFWYVRNNGADGDNWARNNVQTGGAGGIGWKVPMTDDARVLIEALS